MDNYNEDKKMFGVDSFDSETLTARLYEYTKYLSEDYYEEK